MKRTGAARPSRWETPANLRLELPLDVPADAEPRVRLHPVSGPRAIEDEAFPFEALSDIAEKESWRKEINRPSTHIHKWWAQRLGTVFRAMAIAAFAPPGADIFDLFYKPVRIPEGTVFDPFMGSGTTLAEAVKLGARAIGRDINPVAHFLVKCALAVHDRAAILETYRAVEQDVAGTLKSYYQTTLADGTKADVLYYFSESTFYRVLRAHDLQHHRGRAKAPSDPAQPNRATDLRYSLLPHQSTGLWSIRLSPQAGPQEHVSYRTDRNISEQNIVSFYRMLLGESL